MSAANYIGVIVAFLVCVYLIYAMLRGEKL
jgi:hypothetical protein